VYSVRLHFSEPEGLEPGQRTFDVYLQGTLVRQGLDVAAEAGGAYRPLVVRFDGIPVTRELEVRLTPTADMTDHLPVISGIEAIAGPPTVAVAQ
jgi:hypothetical protein